MPRKGYKPTGYRIAQPDPETLIADQGDTKLYACLADCPLYVNCRILSPGLIGTNRLSFRVGWVIAERRFARGGDVSLIPAKILKWVQSHIEEIYPDVETATGMSAQEIQELKADQRAKRKAHEKKEALAELL